MDAGGRAGIGRRLGAALTGLAALALGACSGLPAPGDSSSAGSIDAFVPQAVRFVEAHRGLRFKQPVKVQHLSDQAFMARVIQLQRDNRASLDRQARVLRALGLLKPGVDAERFEEALLRSGVVGFYDPGLKELEVRGDTATLAVRHVVVHELTHALQDQWFTLDTGGGSGDDDANVAYTTLVEGDAVRIETAYIDTLSAQDRQALQALRGPLPANVPQALVELLEFPYLTGPGFVRALLKAGGQQGLDDAFIHHPVSSAQVIHPDRFLAGETPVTVDVPSADGPAIDTGTLGELGLNLLLEGPGGTGTAAGDVWSGDSYVTWGQGSGYCVRDRLAVRTPSDEGTLLAALRRFAASRAGVTVGGSSQPMVTSCG